MIEFVHVFKQFKKGWPILEDINLKIGRSEFLFLAGVSGAGKSTLLYHIYMKEFPSSGQVIVDNMNSASIKKRHIPYLRRKVGMIFQEFYLLNDRSVFENIALPLRLAGVSGREIKKRTLKMLSYTGLTHKSNDSPKYLSSGEKQRICIARALVTDPIVLLADEPTGNLDDGNSSDIFQLLQNINKQGTAVVMATHNSSLYNNSTYRTILIEKGRIKE